MGFNLAVTCSSQLVYRAGQQEDQDEKMAGFVFPMGPESFQRFTPDSLAAIEQRIVQEQSRQNKQYQEVHTHARAHTATHTPGDIIIAAIRKRRRMKPDTVRHRTASGKRSEGF